MLSGVSRVCRLDWTLMVVAVKVMISTSVECVTDSVKAARLKSRSLWKEHKKTHKSVLKISSLLFSLHLLE